MTLKPFSATALTLSDEIQTRTRVSLVFRVTLCERTISAADISISDRAHITPVLTLPDDGGLALCLERVVGNLGELVEGLLERLVGLLERGLGGRVDVVALGVKLVTTGAEQLRGEQVRDRSEEIRDVLRDLVVGEAELASGGL